MTATMRNLYLSRVGVAIVWVSLLVTVDPVHGSLGAFGAALLIAYPVAAATDSPVLAASSPPVTAVNLDAPEIGRRAIQLLIDQIERPASNLHSVSVPSTLILRASSTR